MDDTSESSLADQIRLRGRPRASSIPKKSISYRFQVVRERP